MRNQNTDLSFTVSQDVRSKIMEMAETTNHQKITGNLKPLNCSAVKCLKVDQNLKRNRA